MCRDYDEAWYLIEQRPGTGRCSTCGHHGPVTIETVSPYENPIEWLDIDDGAWAALRDRYMNDGVPDWSDAFADDAWDRADNARGDQPLPAEHVHTFLVCDCCREARRWLMVMCHGYIYGAELEELLEHWAENQIDRTWASARLMAAARCEHHVDRHWHIAGRRLTGPEVAALVDASLAACRALAGAS